MRVDHSFVEGLLDWQTIVLPEYTVVGCDVYFHRTKLRNKNMSCEVGDFVEAHHCKLFVILLLVILRSHTSHARHTRHTRHTVSSDTTVVTVVILAILVILQYSYDSSSHTSLPSLYRFYLLVALSMGCLMQHIYS